MTKTMRHNLLVSPFVLLVRIPAMIFLFIVSCAGTFALELSELLDEVLPQWQRETEIDD